MQGEISELEIRLQALEATSLRILTEADSGAQTQHAQTRWCRRKTSCCSAWWIILPCPRIPAILASLRSPWAEFVASGRYHHRGYTIAGGTSKCSTTSSPNRCWGFNLVKIQRFPWSRLAEL